MSKKREGINKNQPATFAGEKRQFEPRWGGRSHSDASREDPVLSEAPPPPPSYRVCSPEAVQPVTPTPRVRRGQAGGAPWRRPSAYRRAGSLPGSVMLPRWRTGSG